LFFVEFFEVFINALPQVAAAFHNNKADGADLMCEI
jgi:hypothetical protein